MAERALVSLPLPQLRAQLQEARYRQPGRAGGPRSARPCCELQGPGRGWERRWPLTRWVGQIWAGLGASGCPRSRHRPQVAVRVGYGCCPAVVRVWNQLPALLPHTLGGLAGPGSAGCSGSGRDRVWLWSCVLPGVTSGPPIPFGLPAVPCGRVFWLSCFPTRCLAQPRAQPDPFSLAATPTTCSRWRWKCLRNGTVRWIRATRCSGSCLRHRVLQQSFRRYCSRARAATARPRVLFFRVWLPPYCTEP